MKRPIKIAVVGPESTGKSSLSQALAEHYNTVFVPEMARAYINELPATYDESDLIAIARLQCDKEDELVASANDVLVCDTTLLVICIWSIVKYERIEKWIEDEELRRAYDFYLLTDIDLPWEEDPQREHPHLRQFLFDLYKEALIAKNVPFAIVRGLGDERTNNAIHSIEMHLNA